ncbi:hypothetical protein DVH24_016754 [Malus domestica]|uniref:ER membrane protein complex subunit 4 n=1 Tax=Malus domestica TaxID=3750 RepID=A0A498HVA2_MALDO|nr:hypothetical protein DVH24_016754 [Malus domestica]
MPPIKRERERDRAREKGRGILAWVSGRETVRERDREGLDGEQSRVLDLVIFDSASPLLYLTLLEGRMDKGREREGKKHALHFLGLTGYPTGLLSRGCLREVSERRGFSVLSSDSTGYLETEGIEKTWRIKQESIALHLSMPPNGNNASLSSLCLSICIYLSFSRWNNPLIIQVAARFCIFSFPIEVASIKSAPTTGEVTKPDCYRPGIVAFRLIKSEKIWAIRAQCKASCKYGKQPRHSSTQGSSIFHFGLIGTCPPSIRFLAILLLQCSSKVNVLRRDAWLSAYPTYLLCFHFIHVLNYESLGSCTGPIQEFGDDGFMIWMVGSIVHLFSIGITFSALWQPISTLHGVGKGQTGGYAASEIEIERDGDRARDGGISGICKFFPLLPQAKSFHSYELLGPLLPAQQLTYLVFPIFWDIFSFGAIKSATDFQEYNEVAGVSALDFGYTNNTAVYHTKDFIHPLQVNLAIPKYKRNKD